ncbi:hypothetical protein CMI37_32175 [Candidatus Pacearchaeota archaeon]|nr:hypothetical protein [Candidatus Pacearchaeota archaeon]
MGYQGGTIEIDLNIGGFNYNPNLDSLPPSVMTDLSTNITLQDGGRRKRGGTAHVNSSTISGTPQIMKIHDYILTTGTQFLMLAGNDGKVYKNFTDTIKTGLSATNYYDMASMNDLLVFTDGASTLQTWDGAAGSSSDVSTLAPDWATDSLYPQQLEVHGRGLSQRMWTWTTNNKIFGSAIFDADDWGATNGFISDTNQVFASREGGSITGMYEFGDSLFITTNRNTYILQDSNSDISTWGFTLAQFNAGAAHWRVMARTPNDMLIMMDDGEIYSLVTVNAKGDYKASSITEPAFIDRWIRDNIDLTQINEFHMSYDPKIRAVLVFMVKSGSTQVDVCLPYFIDRPVDQAWGAPFENPDSNCGYDASVSSVVRVAAGDYRVRTGDNSTGFVWDLNQTTFGDNGNAYTAKCVLPTSGFGDNVNLKMFKRIVFTGFSTSGDDSDNLLLAWDADGAIQAPQSVTFSGLGAKVDESTSIVDKIIVASSNFHIEAILDLGQPARRIGTHFSNSTVGDDFYVTSVQVDAKPLGRRPTPSVTSVAQ